MNRIIYAEDGEYKICPISDEDRENYVELHRQINGEGTLFLNPVCKDMMWKSVLLGKDKTFSVFDGDDEYCGSIELQHPDEEHPEIGIDLLEEKRNKGIAAKVIRLIAKRAYQDRAVEYFLIRISSRNQHSKYVFEKMGVIPIKTSESTFKNFMRGFKKTIGNTAVDSTIEESLKSFFDDSDELEEEVVYEYKLVPKLFL